MKSPKQNNIKWLSKKLRTIIASSSATPSDSSGAKSPTMIQTRIPVFQLPRKDLLVVPEEEEISEGFSVNLSEVNLPNEQRVFSGLTPLDFCQQAIDQSDNLTAIEYRSFACTNSPSPSVGTE